MSSKWLWLVSVVARRIWFRATLFSIASVSTALVSIVVSPYVPPNLSTSIGSGSVDRILGIIASSMLAVTTFSLSTMVSAYSAAASSVSPRATRLVMEDSTTQNVLATFLGSFLFSLVGIIALATGAYGEQGRVVLFIVTIGLIILIVVTLLRWIDHLSRLGRVTETTRQVEEATIAAIKEWRKIPNLGGRALPEGFDGQTVGAQPVFTKDLGYVQHVDTGALSRIAEEAEIEIALVAIPGKLIAPHTPVAWLIGGTNDDLHERVASCLTVSDIRSFDQDPRFGAAVLAEIASRALSQAINDPGTVIDVTTRALRVLAAWHDTEPEDDEVPYPRLQVAEVTAADLFDDLFALVARDGAGLVEVGVRLQKTLVLLAGYGGEFAENARRHSSDALERADAVLYIDADRQRLRNAATGLVP